MPRAPVATYRVQLGPAFTLDDAAALVPYLAELGVSHLYTSPIAEAELGSPHGYDVVDHHRVRAELGGEPALRRLWAALLAHEMGQVVDLVPNHMSIATHRNRWWWSLLEDGIHSRYASYFDVDWDAPGARGRVVLPFLGLPLRDAVEQGALVAWSPPGEARFTLRHGQRTWPVADSSLGMVGLAPGDCPERIAEAVQTANRHPTLLLELADSQHYELVEWRARERRLNYRRFADIDSLAAVRVDQAPVFADVHRLLAGWMHDDLASRAVQGVRVDHVDGIADPGAYLDRLRELVGDRWVVVEKILAAAERLPASWAVAGTTGYDTAARLTRLFVEPAAEAELVELARAAEPRERTWEGCVAAAKRELATGALRPEAERAARALAGDPPARDLTATLDQVIEDAVALRTYRRYGAPHHQPAYAVRFAQLTAPLSAKAIEDTAFYRWLPLVALNEVGNDPARFGADAPAIHDEAVRSAAAHPLGMSTISTHDTKWSADARLRLALVSHDVQGWREVVTAWSAHNRRHRTGTLPDQAIEYLYYQALVAAWPIDRARTTTYLVKAARERRRHTSWTNPDERYETALRRFVDGTLGDPAFTSSLAAFVARLDPAARALGLAQVTLLLTMPGVPDLYQGDELWNHSLVDPDNRRPVDFEERRRALRDATSSDPALWWGEAGDRVGDGPGLAKIGVINQLLRLRRARPDLFDEHAGYTPLPLSGPEAGKLIAFARAEALVVVVRRAPVDPGSRNSPDATVELPAGRWRDVLGGWRGPGGRTPVSELHDPLPSAALIRADGP
ncbi:alpha-amylase family glycosyl hydrolase [Rhabdothermincola sediminis]|uniref:alpha-amylase family glycosyl hydrolase n=1 Tax=Rhabdothermincola sediminis TaxID=2751370 RepID=UPI001AA03E52|nr:malto-oligosyltrehalose synthase [Rhabdothermincola sediminis]